MDFSSHSFHLLLLSLTFALGLIIWFWDNLSQKRDLFRSLILLVAVIFLVLHISPLSTLIVEHHQSQDHGNSHICCLTPASDQVPSSVFEQQSSVFIEKSIFNLSPTVLSDNYSLNNKSPPTS